MGYPKITVEVVVDEDDVDVFTRSATDALDRIEKTTMVYCVEIFNTEADEALYAPEIASKIN